MFFFFSSRRRHTRYIGDWSSDVCSSDLRAAADLTRPEHVERAHRDRRQRELVLVRVRSEERRVGKECRCRCWPWQLKRKIKGADYRMRDDRHKLVRCTKEKKRHKRMTLS